MVVVRYTGVVTVDESAIRVHEAIALERPAALALLEKLAAALGVAVVGTHAKPELSLQRAR